MAPEPNWPKNSRAGARSHHCPTLELGFNYVQQSKPAKHTTIQLIASPGSGLGFVLGSPAYSLHWHLPGVFPVILLARFSVFHVFLPPPSPSFPSLLFFPCHDLPLSSGVSPCSLFRPFIATVSSGYLACTALLASSPCCRSRRLVSTCSISWLRLHQMPVFCCYSPPFSAFCYWGGLLLRSGEGCRPGATGLCPCHCKPQSN